MSDLVLRRRRLGRWLVLALLLAGAGLWLVRGELRLALRRLHSPALAPGELGDGGPARALRLFDPMGLAQDPDGNVFVSDRGRGLRGRLIWRITPDGVAHALAGTGSKGDPLPGVEALRSPLRSPEGLCLDAAGRLVFADQAASLVLRIDAAGRLERVAGTGARGFGGDGGPATDATLHQPYDVRADSRGNLFVADVANHRIRRIGADGIITTVAGTGEAGYSGDGGPAREARLHTPYGVFLDARDRLWIADTENHVVRRVDGDGTITTVAGTGRRGFGGDGGPAREALLDAPQSLWIDAGGRVFVGDEHNHAVRVIDPDGTISTLAGDGRPGRAEDGAAGARARLRDPEAVLLRPDGTLLVTDGDNGRVVRLDRAGRLQPFAGAP
jgi:sugar lactone lactonase YvrE